MNAKLDASNSSASNIQSPYTLNRARSFVNQSQGGDISPSQFDSPCSPIIPANRRGEKLQASSFILKLNGSPERVSKRPASIVNYERGAIETPQKAYLSIPHLTQDIISNISESKTNKLPEQSTIHRRK